MIRIYSLWHLKMNKIYSSILDLPVMRHLNVLELNN